jgi:hypothetical protein
MKKKSPSTTQTRSVSVGKGIVLVDTIYVAVRFLE